MVQNIFSKNFPGDPDSLLREAEVSCGVKLDQLAKINLERFLDAVKNAVHGRTVAKGKAETWESKFALGVLRRILEKHV
jgi:hypothetical protein